MLKLSLRSYRVPRTVVVDNVSSSLKVATLGITAGSGFATEELACLLLDVCDDLQANYPTVDLTEYVDDLTLGHSGPGWFITDILASATDYVIGILGKRLGLEVSAKMSAVTASAPKQAATIAAKITSGEVQARKRDKMIGVGTNSAMRRSVLVLETRLKSTKEKGKGFRTPRRAGVNTAVWARTAGQMSMLYGADTSGVSDSMLKEQRVTIAAAHSAPGGGKNPTMVNWMHGCSPTKSDLNTWSMSLHCNPTPRLAGKRGYHTTSWRAPTNMPAACWNPPSASGRPSRDRLRQSF